MLVLLPGGHCLGGDAVGSRERYTARCCTISLLRSCGAADLELPNVDKDPQVVSAQQEIREWTALQEKKVEAWHTREKAKLGNAQEREMKAFEEQLRRMRCAAMHKALVKKLAIAQESATTLVERRARAKEEAWAVYKTNEIFQKASTLIAAY